MIDHRGTGYKEKFNLYLVCFISSVQQIIINPSVLCASVVNFIINMNQRKIITVVALVLVGLFIGEKFKMVKIGLIMGLILGLLGGSLLSNKINEK